MIHRLPPDVVASLHAVLDTTLPQSKPRLRRVAASRSGASRQGRDAKG
jgi:hypothetical protein